jgi:integrase
VVAELERIWRERRLIYKTLVLTGLRKGELASLTIGQLELDGPVAYAVLHAADEKTTKAPKSRCGRTWPRTCAGGSPNAFSSRSGQGYWRPAAGAAARR